MRSLPISYSAGSAGPFHEEVYFVVVTAVLSFPQSLEIIIEWTMQAK